MCSVCALCVQLHNAMFQVSGVNVGEDRKFKFVTKNKQGGRSLYFYENMAENAEAEEGSGVGVAAKTVEDLHRDSLVSVCKEPNVRVCICTYKVSL